jgi:hypothetical protein
MMHHIMAENRQATTRPGVGTHNIGRDKTHVRRLQRTTTKPTKKRCSSKPLFWFVA